MYCTDCDRDERPDDGGMVDEYFSQRMHDYMVSYNVVVEILRSCYPPPALTAAQLVAST